jgi:ABC-type glycerol-3-phosphate transport system substrate-binding protein
MGYYLRELWWSDVFSFHFGVDRVYGEANRKYIRSPEMEQYFRLVEGYVEKYGAKELEDFGASLGQWNTAKFSFYAEDVAMILQGEWFNYFTNIHAPDLEYKTGLWPSSAATVNKRGGPMVYHEADVIMIPKTTKHPDEAFTFLWYWGGPEGQAPWHLDEDGCGRATSIKDYGAMNFVERSPNSDIEISRSIASSADRSPRSTQPTPRR